MTFLCGDHSLTVTGNDEAGDLIATDEGGDIYEVEVKGLPNEAFQVTFIGPERFKMRSRAGVTSGDCTIAP